MCPNRRSIETHPGSPLRVLARQAISIVLLGLLAGCMLHSVADQQRPQHPTPVFECRRDLGERDLDELRVAIWTVAAPNARQTAIIRCVLDTKLADWGSFSNELVADALDAVGDKNLREAIPEVRRFVHLRPSPSTPNAELVIPSAIRALARVAGDAAFDDLAWLADQGTENLRGPAALALSVVGDRRALPYLRRMTASGPERARGDAMNALASFCDRDSCDDDDRRILRRAVDSQLDEERVAAIWWLSRRGTFEDGPALARALSDTRLDVREHALEGLLRLRSPAGCGFLCVLASEPWPGEQDLVEQYRSVCQERGKSHPR